LGLYSFSKQNPTETERFKTQFNKQNTREKNPKISSFIKAKIYYSTISMSEQDRTVVTVTFSFVHFCSIHLC